MSERAKYPPKNRQGNLILARESQEKVMEICFAQIVDTMDCSCSDLFYPYIYITVHVYQIVIHYFMAILIHIFDDMHEHHTCNMSMVIRIASSNETSHEYTFKLKLNGLYQYRKVLKLK